MGYSLTTITPATALAVSIADLKSHLRIDHAYDDAHLDPLIRTCTAWVERACGIQCLTTVLRYSADSFPCDGIIRLPRYPVSAVSAVKYKAPTTGTLTTISSSVYQTDLYAAPARVMPAVNSSWPDVQSGAFNAVQVEFSAGYGTDADDVDPVIVLAVKMLVTHFYENRDLRVEGNAGVTNHLWNEVPSAVLRILDGVRLAEMNT